MRNILHLLFLLPAFFAYNQEEEEYVEDEEIEQIESPYYFYEGQMVYLLEDNVTILKEPNIASKIVATLPLGTKLKIVSRSDMMAQFNDFEDSWYLVQYDDKKQGYVWGGKIAVFSFRSSKDTDYIFHFGLEKRNEYGRAVYQIRVEKDHKQLQTLSFEGLGGIEKLHAFKNYGNRGITNIDDIIYVETINENDDYGSGSIVFFWSEGQLTLIKELESSADYPVFVESHFLFPSDMAGEKGKILFHEEDGEYVEESENADGVVYSKNETTRWEWNGKTLVEVK